MERESSDQIKIRIVEVSLILLAICGAPLAYNALAEDAPLSAAQARVAAPRLPKIPAAHAAGAPVHLTIRSIGLDAAIETVALAADGSMGVPKHPLDAGWYQFGPHPGEKGSAAIDGHVDWYNGQRGVFEHLHEVKPGDQIIVQDESGTLTFFTVRSSRTYAAADDANEVFISTDGKSHLNLITCEGVWNKQAKQYSERLVVFADKE